MDPVLEQKNNRGGSSVDGRAGEDYAAKSSADDKLQILQLQCIIDAKDREMSLLRDKLSGQEDSHIITSLQSDVARLQQEVQRLGRENAALRAQLLTATGEDHPEPDSAPSASRDPNSGSSNPASPGSSLSATDAVSQTAPPLPVGCPNPSNPAVDADVLIQKLRSVVSGLVSDALAAQQAQPQGQSQGPQQLRIQGEAPGPQPPAPAQTVTVGGAGNAGSTAGWGAVLQPAVLPAQVAAAVHPGWAAALPCVLLPLSYLPAGLPPAPGSWTPAAAGTPAGPFATPWGQPPAPLPHTNFDSSGGRSRSVPPVGPIAAPSGHVAPGTRVSGSNRSTTATGDASAVLELNVDGSPICLERALLETQARGSRLYELLTQEYDRLPLDSRGRPFLSYDPVVFQALLAALRDRWLLGAAATPRNWAAIARSLGVHVSYFKMVASLVGLGDEVSHALPEDDSNTSQVPPAPPTAHRSAFSSQLPLPPPSSDMAEDGDALARTTAAAGVSGSTGGGSGGDAGAPAAAGPRAQPGGGGGGDMPPAAAGARFRVANMYSLLAQKQAAEAAREVKEGHGA